MTVTEDRRSHRRAPMALMAALETSGQEAPVLVLDLSPMGARIKSDGPPPTLGSEHVLHFTVHRTAYQARFRVVHWVDADGSYLWGGELLDLTAEERGQLRRVVDAATGQASLWVRGWLDVQAEASTSPATQVLVGATPAGQDIRLLGSDCLEMGPDGVHLFVTVVAGLEHA